jgi:hydroxyacylglutathione hydrolase
MIRIAPFTFNAFQENTYILNDETSECVIIDPGCDSAEEKKVLVDFIEREKLKPVKLLLTHAHIDHIMGNSFLSNKYGLKIEMNELEAPVLKAAPLYAEMYGIPFDPSPDATVFLNEGDEVKFGNSVLKILFTPGHSPGALCFYNTEQKFIIAGDVLFHESIGRTDLPYGDHETLIKNIREKLFTLPDDFKVFSGHGPTTTIGHEKRNNPFLIS